MSTQKISFQDERALSYVRAAAESLLEQGRNMVDGLPDIMQKSGQAVNASIEGVFSECDFFFALYVEKDLNRPERMFLGLSSLCSLACLSASSYYFNGDKAGVVNYLGRKKFIDELTETLYDLMKSVYKHVTE